MGPSIVLYLSSTSIKNLLLSWFLMSTTTPWLSVGTSTLDPSGVALRGAAVESVVNRHPGGAALAQGTGNALEQQQNDVNKTPPGVNKFLIDLRPQLHRQSRVCTASWRVRPRPRRQRRRGRRRGG